MTAQAALTAALREMLGPNARAHGFKGSSPTWRKSNTAGDWAVVNVQSSPHSTSENLECVVNIAVAPEPWLRWSRAEPGRTTPKLVTEYQGLYRERLHPGEIVDQNFGWWAVGGAESGFVAAADMVVQLEAAGWPVIDRMLAPGGMLDQVRRGDLGRMRRSSQDVFFARAEALLLMDRGPGVELEQCLRHALEHVIAAQRAHAEHFDTWVRKQSRVKGQQPA